MQVADEDVSLVIKHMRAKVAQVYKKSYVHPGNAPVRVVTGNQQATETTRMGGNFVGGNLYPKLWAWLQDKFKLNSALDVGCGIGESTYVMSKMHFDVKCIEGYDKNLELGRRIFPDINMQKIDFEHDTYAGENVDLVWCSEVAEHVPPENIDNFMAAMTKGRVIAATFPPPGVEGHNHVNLQTSEWWKATFAKYGFVYDAATTAESLNFKIEHNRGHKWWETHNGMIFVKKN